MSRGKKLEPIILPKIGAHRALARRDSFNAGFLYSYLKGFDLAKSVTVANWVASKTVQGVGISSLPEEKELNEFIDSYEF
jgi:ribokinase